MTEDQYIRRQCLELAVKAGTPWNRLTEIADRLTAYVKGVAGAELDPSIARALTSAGLDEYKRTGVLPETNGIPTDQEMPLEEQTAAKGVAVEDIFDTQVENVASAMEEPVDRGEPVEEPAPSADIYGDETARRSYNAQRAVPGVANDPRLPLVTM